MNTSLILMQLAGAFVLVATMVLLFFRKVYLDAETKQPVEFTVPVMGTIKTQSPVLILIVVGAVMVGYPITRLRPKMVPLSGEVHAPSKTVQAVVVAVPDYTYTQFSSGSFTIKVPLLATEASYRVKFIVDQTVIDDQPARLENDSLVLDRKVSWNPPADEGGQGEIPVRKDISDEELHRLGL